MDLGRPVARHLIRRPHEIDDVDAVLADAPDVEAAADDQPVGSEPSER